MRSESYISVEKQLGDINETLINRNLLNGKIGIFAPGGMGDVMTAMSVLKYKDILWPDKNIIWFCNPPNAEALKFNDKVFELRVFQWESIDVDPNTQLKDINNRLRKDRKLDFKEVGDLDDAYFPVPWMYSVNGRHGIDYPNISRRCFGIDSTWEWHPYLCFSQDERVMVDDFCKKLPYKRTIMIETFAGSGQTGWNDELTRITLDICRKKWGKCNFIFASHKYLNNNYEFPKDILDQDGTVSVSHMTVRQTALVNDYCDLFVGVSSGISVATSCWGAKPVPKIQYCNSFICSTVSLSNGTIELVCPNGRLNNLWDQFDKNSRLRLVFEYKLRNILNKIE